MRAVSRTLSAGRHSLGAIAEAFLVVAIVATLLAALAPMYKPAGWFAGAADARNHAPTNGTTIQVNDGRFGGATTGLVTGGTATWVHATCVISDGTVGLDAWARPDASGGFSLQLGPTPSWQSGGASCTATAGYYSSNGRWRALASTTFTVYGV